MFQGDYTNCLMANPYSVCRCSCGGEFHGMDEAAAVYETTVCANCGHPGGLHRIDQWEPRVTHCLCCPDCPAWVRGPKAGWSSEMTWHFIPEYRPAKLTQE